MPMHFKCPCGDAIFAPDGSAGRKGECPSCGKILNVPAEAITTGATMPGRRAPAPSFDEEPLGLGSLSAVGVEEAPAAVLAAPPAAGELPPVIEIEAPAAPEPFELEEAPELVEPTPEILLPAAEQAPPLVEIEDLAVPAELPAAPELVGIEEGLPSFEIEEQPVEIPLAEEPPAPAPLMEEIEPMPAPLEEFAPVEGVPDLASTPTEELSAPAPPARRPPARKPSRRKAAAPERPSRRERPSRASRPERGAKPSRAERPSKRSARKSAGKPAGRRGGVCRNCGMGLRPGETTCPECGAKAVSSSAVVYLLIMVIIVLLALIVMFGLACARPEMLPEQVREPIHQVLKLAGLTAWIRQSSEAPEAPANEGPLPEPGAE